MIIAIDGPEASGKGTAAKIIAEKYGLRHLDSGLLYRLTGHALLERNITDDTKNSFIIEAVKAASNITPELMDHLPDNIRSMEVGQMASKVAIIPKVRNILTNIQQEIAEVKPGAVIDGRDIGTVVCPNADVKFWLDATLESRAERRLADYQAKGRADTLDEVKEAIEARDHRDRSRSTAPMKKADDAHLIETSKMGIETVVETLSSYIDAKLAECVGEGQGS